MSTLLVSVAAADAGPVLVLAGEADVTNAEQLRAAIGAQLASGAVYLTIDAGGLSYADSMSIGILAGTGRTLKELGGALILLRPQERVLRTMTLLGVGQVIVIRAAAGGARSPHSDAAALKPTERRTDPGLSQLSAGTVKGPRALAMPPPLACARASGCASAVGGGGSVLGPGR
jgi:anti-anti-sigma factor